MSNAEQPNMTPTYAMARVIEQGFDQGEQLIDLMPSALQALADNITDEMVFEAMGVLDVGENHIVSFRTTKAALIAALTAAKGEG